MSTPTPRTDAVVYATEVTMEPTSVDRYDRMANHARQLERELSGTRIALNTWEQKAVWQESRIAQLERELEELHEWKRGKKGIEDFYIVREELHKTQSRLTAHRDALRLAEEALLRIAGRIPSTATKVSESSEDALAAIAKLKEDK